MDPDLAIILGLVTACIAVLSILSALSDSRPPRVPALIVLVAGALILYGAMTKPGGYAFGDIPDTFFTVIGRFIP